MSDSLDFLFALPLFGFAVMFLFLATRWFWLWYWRIDRAVSAMERIADALEGKGKGNPRSEFFGD